MTDAQVAHLQHVLVGQPATGTPLLTCVSCGGSFLRKAHGRTPRYCSVTCQPSSRYRPVPRVAGRCASCGTAFQGTKHQRYCSRTCRHAAAYQRHLVPCACGRLKSPEHRQCEQCDRQRRRKGMRTSGTCLGCGTSFRRLHTGRHDAMKYCTRACAMAHIRDWVVVPPLPRAKRKPPKPPRHCVTCDRPCPPRHHLYCSVHCRTRAFIQRRQFWIDARRPPDGVRYCPGCGQTFLGAPNRLFCTAPCSRRYHHHPGRYPHLGYVTDLELRAELAQLIGLVRAARIRIDAERKGARLP